MKSRAMIAILALSLAALACQATRGLGRDEPTPTPTGLFAHESAITPQATATPTPTPISPPASAVQPVRLTGSMSFSNDIITTYYEEHAVALTDLHGFVLRDKEWPLPVAGQALGFMDLDEEALTATYTLDLPAEPAGVISDVDGDPGQEGGVQIFAVSYSPNLTGGPYSEGDDPSYGWPTGFASVLTDPENGDEITGGRLVVWSPDAQQVFPTAFGADGLLFTADDPTAPLPAGYSVIDLDEQPFAVLREREPRIDLFEPADLAVKDFSDQPYSAAFEQMFERIRTEYAFNGIAGKEPDWDALWADLEPRVAEAEQQEDPRAFYEALRDFSLAFKDGHVSISGGEYEDAEFNAAAAGGLGLALTELDDGRVIVSYINPGGPADEAGLRLGMEILTWNDQPVAEAVADFVPFGGPFSTEHALRTQQLRYLTRVPEGEEIELGYQSPGAAAPRSVTLTAVFDPDTFGVTSIYRDYDPTGLPVEYRILDSGVGYIRIQSNYDDLNLLIRIFQRALEVFSQNDVPGVIIDLRQNPGGASLGLAGFLTDQEIPLGQLEYYSDATGQFEPEGPREKVLPNEEQYRFPQAAILVSQACASACEIEAYGFSQVPGMMVVGYEGTAGIEAETARGQFLLPEGFDMTVPTGRFTLPDGSIFLEGVGVQPTLRVEKTAENVLSDEDVVLRAAEQAVLLPPGAGVEPSGPPVLSDPAEARALLEAGTPALEDRAREQYDEISQAGQTYTYTVALPESEPLLWLNGWCASDIAALEENFEHIQTEFLLNSETVPASDLASADFKSGSQQCRLYYTALDDWPAGEHHLEIRVTFDQPIDDGTQTYPAGTHSYVYDVYVAGE